MAYGDDVRHVIRQIMTKEKYLTLSQASAYTGLSHRTLQRYVASGKLPSIKNEAGVRQIPTRSLMPYVTVECTIGKVGDETLKVILLEMLDLIQTKDIETLAKKQALRFRIQQTN